ncbi:pyridoxal phosphate-dependent transferase [Lasiosphaeris hirsuta]|uniref:Pyridoxal phosphate-dependent transferase n=1 Tax=Lasiosphaeris hirsuta TaxID=260670 RepID=A0AA40B9U4_9PEZI|nr:pyridoxal phosphate-dependent transferase [Lasiosphaeris hirsuta]
MVKIAPFEVEQWMDRFENTPGVLNIAETCSASVSIDELVELCTDQITPGPLAPSTKLTYGSIRGSTKLRQHIAALLNKSSPTTDSLQVENIVITQGAIAANFLLFFTLVGPGDHVVCVYPAYQQLYAVPESLGAEVSLWRLKHESGWVPNVEELESLVKPSTKLIVINNPNNPTGSTIPTCVLDEIIAFAEPRGITVLSDEVYSPLYHSLPSGQAPPPSIVALRRGKTVSTGSMSKAFSLAGIRVGWIATRDKALIEAVVAARDYTAISVSQLDDQVATYALSDSVLPSLLERNTVLAQTNLALLDAFVQRFSSVCSWVKPTAGTTAFILFKKWGEAVDDEDFAISLLNETSVLFTAARRCFGLGKDFRGFVRIGYVCHTEVLQEGLNRLGGYIEKHLL